MSKRRYHFKPMTQEQLAELQKRYPKTVQSITILKPVYSIISKMMDCELGNDIPEVQLMSSEEAAQEEQEEEKKQGVLAVDEDKPVELKGAAPRKKVGLAV